MAWVFYYHDLGFRDSWAAAIEPFRSVKVCVCMCVCAYCAHIACLCICVFC